MSPAINGAAIVTGAQYRRATPDRWPQPRDVLSFYEFLINGFVLVATVRVGRRSEPGFVTQRPKPMPSPISNTTLTASEIAHLEERARFIRLETNPTHQHSEGRPLFIGLFGRRTFRDSLVRHDAIAPRRARVARPRPLPDGQRTCGRRALPCPRRSRLFSEGLLDDYTRLGSPLGDHPDMRKVPGIDFSSGSIGHALSAGLGMALGARIQGLDFRTFVHARRRRDAGRPGLGSRDERRASRAR